jgi:hypothetical protein
VEYWIQHLQHQHVITTSNYNPHVVNWIFIIKNSKWHVKNIQ